MGWSIDSIIWNSVRKYLKNRYAGVAYSMLTSNSPVVIRYRGPELTRREMQKIAHMFPSNIRVEFQEVTYEGEKNVLWGRGDLGPNIEWHPPEWAVTKDTGHPERVYEKEGTVNIS